MQRRMPIKREVQVVNDDVIRIGVELLAGIAFLPVLLVPTLSAALGASAAYLLLERPSLKFIAS